MSKILLCLFFSVGLTAPVLAQFHHSGQRGIFFSYLPGKQPSQGTNSPGFGTGYQFFINRKLQIEFMGAYLPQQHVYRWQSEQFDVSVESRQTDLRLHESVNYAVTSLFRHLYINLGLGLSQRYRWIEDQAFHYQVDSTRLQSLMENEQTINDTLNTVKWEPERGIRVGGHAQILLELYLYRRLTLLARYRASYFIKTRQDPVSLQGSVGLRFNF